MKYLKKSNFEKPYQPIKDRSKLVLTLCVFAFFIGFGFIIFLYPVTLIDFFTLSKIMVGCTVVGLLIPLKLYEKWFQFIKYEMIIFNVLGVGPFASGLFLLLNFLIVTNSQTINYQIIGYHISGNNIELELRSKIQHINSKITTMSDVDMYEFGFAKTIDISIADGIFGLKVIKNREFKP